MSVNARAFSDMRKRFHVPVWADDEQSASKSQSDKFQSAKSQFQSESVDCGRFPYPNNEIVSHLVCSIDRDILCRIRDILFDEIAVRNNASDFPDVYDGGVLGNNNRLSPRQLLDLKNMLEAAYEATRKSLRFDIDALVACKIVVGRWLRPSEMSALFGKNASQLVTKRYAVSAEGNDTKVLTNGKDPRISYAIGRAGVTLNELTAKSRTIYIWFGMLKGQAHVYIYGRTAQSLEKARMLLNRHQSTFKGSGKGNGQRQKGFHVEASVSAPRKVSLNAMYKMLQR